jgi:hypothetical protein
MTFRPCVAPDRYVALFHFVHVAHGTFSLVSILGAAATQSAENSTCKIASRLFLISTVAPQAISPRCPFNLCTVEACLGSMIY